MLYQVKSSQVAFNAVCIYAVNCVCQLQFVYCVLMILTGSEVVDQILSVLLSTHMFVGGVVAFILDNTIPGNSMFLLFEIEYITLHYIQELSYRSQIARQLRTQYAAGIYKHKYYTVTLKPRLRVIQGHWKRNHWIDHTRLTISRVIDFEY